ncbi:MAG: hypothetical protein ACOX8V_03235 [Thermoleophilia bacterium]|jgi:CRISPR/Cas system-associated protein Csm6
MVDRVHDWYEPVNELRREHCPEQQSLLRRTANLTDSKLPDPERVAIDCLRDAVQAELAASDVQIARTLSAEINGIITYYGGSLYDRDRLARDEHVLVVTDTYQGEVAAGLVKGWLENQGFKVIRLLRLPGLE